MNLLNTEVVNGLMFGIILSIILNDQFEHLQYEKRLQNQMALWISSNKICNLAFQEHGYWTVNEVLALLWSN